MNVLYNMLFRLRASGLFSDEALVDFLSFQPTGGCRKLMMTYHLLSRTSDKGIDVFYDSTALAAPKWPIVSEEKFYFLVRVKQEEFWFYVDTRNWKSGEVFFLTNPSYNGNADVTIDFFNNSGPFKFFQLQFKYVVTLEDVQSIITVKDASSNIVQTKVVRARVKSEPIHPKEMIDIDLTAFGEGLYEIEFMTAAGVQKETVFCSPDYTLDAIAVVEMTYKTGAWTGANPDQKYRVSLGGRSLDWYYNVHIRPRVSNPIDPTKLTIEHKTNGVALTLNQVPNSIPLTNDYVQFKSATPIIPNLKPIHLRLNNPDATNTLIEFLPMPRQPDLFLQGNVLTANMHITV